MGELGICVTVFAACALWGSGCGDSERSSPLPQIVSRGGPVMAHPQIVPIFFSDDLEASHEYSHPDKASCAYADWSFTPSYCPQ